MYYFGNLDFHDFIFFGFSMQVNVEVKFKLVSLTEAFSLVKSLLCHLRSLPPLTSLSPSNKADMQIKD